LYEEVVEGKEEWLERRFKKIAEKKRIAGGILRLTDIKREMSLKPNTYKKYAFLIKGLIEQLGN